MCKVHYNNIKDVYDARKELSHFLAHRRKMQDVDDLAFLASVELYMLKNIEAFGVEVEILITEYLAKQERDELSEKALLLALAALIREYFLLVGLEINTRYSEKYDISPTPNFESFLLPYISTRVNNILPAIISNLDGNVNVKQRSMAIAFTELGFIQSVSERLTMEKLNSQKPIKKYWLGVLDDRIRDNHLSAVQFYNRNNPIAFNELFLVGGEWLKYPRDSVGSAKNIINCRCYLGYVV
jgi:hypothetical protein